MMKSSHALWLAGIAALNLATPTFAVWTPPTVVTSDEAPAASAAANAAVIDEDNDGEDADDEGAAPDRIHDLDPKLVDRINNHIAEDEDLYGAKNQVDKALTAYNQQGVILATLIEQALEAHSPLLSALEYAARNQTFQGKVTEMDTIARHAELTSTTRAELGLYNISLLTPAKAVTASGALEAAKHILSGARLAAAKCRDNFAEMLGLLPGDDIAPVG